MAFFLESLSPENSPESRERDGAAAETTDADRTETLKRRSALIWSIYKEAE